MLTETDLNSQDLKTHIILIPIIDSNIPTTNFSSTNINNNGQEIPYSHTFMFNQLHQSTNISSFHRDFSDLFLNHFQELIITNDAVSMSEIFYSFDGIFEHILYLISEEKKKSKQKIIPK